MARRPLPPEQQYRCGACGNKTRFDEVQSIRRRVYRHTTVGGAVISVEVLEVLKEAIEEVTCSKCGRSDDIQVIEAIEVTTPEGTTNAAS